MSHKQPRHVAFLRAINVGGRRVKNDQLIEIFEGVGLRDVATYQAAGNVIFAGAPDAASIERALNEGLGYNVPTILRSIDRVAHIAATVPFTDAELTASAGKVQVSILARAPTADKAAELLALETDDDRLHIDGAELYWLPRWTMTESNLNVRLIERLVGTQTWRAHSTMRRLAARFGANDTVRA